MMLRLVIQLKLVCPGVYVGKSLDVCFVLLFMYVVVAVDDDDD